MKKTMITIALFMIAFTGLAQQINYGAKGIRVVKVKDWDSKVLFFMPKFWINNTDTIMKQLGIAEYLNFKKFSQIDHIPTQLTLWKGMRAIASKEERAQLNIKLQTLKMYKIADWSEVFEGKQKKRAILRVPYNENMYWDLTAKWETIYFVFPDELIEVEN